MQGNSPKAQNEHVSSQITPRLHGKLHGWMEEQAEDRPQRRENVKG